MPFNGTGTFVRIYDWEQDLANKIKIRADRHDAEMDDYADGLSDCITRDGQGLPTANIPWNNYKITGLANGTASGDAINYGQFGTLPFLATNGTATRTLAERCAAIVDVSDFGAVGDGSDETTEIQAAATALRTLSSGKPGILLFPNVGGTYGVTAPILIPQNCTVMGYGSGRDGSTKTVIKALTGFTSTYTMLHKVSGSQTTYNVAAILLSYEWTQNTAFAKAFAVQGVTLDADYKNDNRGAPIHCAMNYGDNAEWTGPIVRLFNTQGFGIWHNTLLPNGSWGGDASIKPIYVNHRARNTSGQTSANTYTTHEGTYPYSAFMFGALEGVRDDATNTAEPALLTDGIAQGLVAVANTWGHAITVTRAGGWRITHNQTNGAGFDGIRAVSMNKGFIAFNIVDGVAVSCPNSSGILHGINIIAITGQSTTNNPTPVIVAFNHVIMRPRTNKTGNDAVAYRLSAGSDASVTVSALFLGNVASVRSDFGSDTFSFYRVGGGGSTFNLQTTNNQVFEDAYLAGVQYGSWGGGAIREEIEGNSWQYRTSAPSAGFYQTGAKVWNKSPYQGSNTGWVCVTQGSPGTWVQFGAAKLAAITTAQFDKTNTTLANVTGLSLTLTAGKTYRFISRLFYDANVTGGHKYAMAGTATATAISYQINSIANATNAFVINSRQTALAGSAGQAGSTAGYTEIAGVITVNAAGTLTVQFAQNASSGTSSILIGSTLEAVEI